MHAQGGERCLLHGDKGSEHLLSDIVGAQPLEGQRNLNMESLYDYGSRAGFWRVRLCLHMYIYRFELSHICVAPPRFHIPRAPTHSIRRWYGHGTQSRGCGSYESR